MAEKWHQSASCCTEHHLTETGQEVAAATATPPEPRALTRGSHELRLHSVYQSARVLFQQT